MATDPNQRYRIVRRLDAGGMAEVFLGRSVSMEGFEKAVAIKRVLPSLSANAKFINMFKDEARLSLYLNHANIVSVFEVGRVDDVHFIVMEYIEGTNLRRLHESQMRSRRPMPISLAVYLGVEVCKGLDYAHTRTDPDGNPLNIVHRDISPPNILLSNEGEVKLTDFGLAKAKSQVELTDPGVVKGKFSYLSPEASWGEEVDLRADIYATGIILWELLTGDRLFLGDTDVQTLEMVRKGDIPSLRERRPDVDEELEAIILRALAKDLPDRYQSAREMGTALSRYLANNGILVTAFDLASYIQGMEDPEASSARTDEVAVDQGIEEELNRLIGLDAASESSMKTETAAGTLNPMDWDLGGDDWGAGFDVPDLPPAAPAPAPPPTPPRPAPPPARPPAPAASAGPPAPQRTMAMGSIGAAQLAQGAARLSAPPPAAPPPAAAPAPAPAMPQPRPAAPGGPARTMAGLPSIPMMGAPPAAPPQPGGGGGPAKTMIGLQAVGAPIAPAASPFGEPAGGASGDGEMELSSIAEFASPIAESIQQAPPPQQVGSEPQPIAAAVTPEHAEPSTPQNFISIEEETAVDPNADEIANKEALAARAAARAARAAARAAMPQPEEQPLAPPEDDDKTNTLFIVLMGLILMLGFLVVYIFTRS